MYAECSHERKKKRGVGAGGGRMNVTVSPGVIFLNYLFLYCILRDLQTYFPWHILLCLLYFVRPLLIFTKFNYILTYFQRVLVPIFFRSIIIVQLQVTLYMKYTVCVFHLSTYLLTGFFCQWKRQSALGEPVTFAKLHFPSWYIWHTRQEYKISAGKF